jgi:hypothetical protein
MKKYRAINGIKSSRKIKKTEHAENLTLLTHSLSNVVSQQNDPRGMKFTVGRLKDIGISGINGQEKISETKFDDLL